VVGVNVTVILLSLFSSFLQQKAVGK